MANSITLAPNCKTVTSCFICGTHYSCEKNLAIHLKTHINRNPERLEEINLASQWLVVNRSKCSLCSTTFESKYAGYIHRQLLCPGKSTKPIAATPHPTTTGIVSTTIGGVRKLVLSPNSTTNSSRSVLPQQEIIPKTPMVPEAPKVRYLHDDPEFPIYSPMCVRTTPPNPGEGEALLLKVQERKAAKKKAMNTPLKVSAENTPNNNPAHQPTKYVAPTNTNAQTTSPKYVGRIPREDVHKIQLLQRWDRVDEYKTSEYHDLLMIIFKQDRSAVYKFVASCLAARESGHVAMFDKIHLEGREVKYYPLRLGTEPGALHHINWKGDIWKMNMYGFWEKFGPNVLDCFIVEQGNIRSYQVSEHDKYHKGHPIPSYVTYGFDDQDWTNHMSKIGKTSYKYAKKVFELITALLAEKYREQGVPLPY